MHRAERVAIATLRGLLGKATAAFGEVRLAELSPKDILAYQAKEKRSDEQRLLRAR